MKQAYRVVLGEVSQLIVELTIRNFAIIPSLTVSFSKGLHALTGETGAGKSIIIDALTILLGGRASVDFVRQGAKKAEIEALFELPNDHPVNGFLEELGIEAEEGSLIIRREISLQGKSVCRINGQLVTLASLREIGQQLVDIHGQHEHQALFREENYLPLLDSYGAKGLRDHVAEYQQLYQQYKEIKKRIEELTENEQQLAHRLDLLRFQKEEISAARLNIGEDEALLQAKRKGQHSQKLFEGVYACYEALTGDGRALSSLADMMGELHHLAEIDQELQPVARTIGDMYYQLEEIGYFLSQYKDNLEFEPEELNEIEQRLMLIDGLKRKYGNTIEEILDYLAKIEQELEQIEHKEERTEELLDQQKQILARLLTKAEQITKIRKDLAQKLVEEMKKELQGLYMDQTRLEIRIAPLATGERVEYEGEIYHINQYGGDEVQFLIAPNPGEEPKPLAKIASGGEMSRFMLALKTVFSKQETVSTLIFDEIDTGVSGRVAQAMGEKLYRLSLDHQVLCITHHAQVAAMADEHYLIEKRVTSDQKTETTIMPLTTEKRILEIAKMMSGVEVTEVTKEHADELLETAEHIKRRLRKSE